MGKIFVVVGLLAVSLASEAIAQARGSSDRALGAELNRERAETRIERLRQDQRQKEQRPAQQQQQRQQQQR